MQKCVIHDSSLRFSRAVYGIIALVGFFIYNKWLILAVAIMTLLASFGVKWNIFYQFHAMFIRRFPKEQQKLIEKESAELNFVSGATSFLLFLGFALVLFEQTASFGWIFILITDLLIFLACFVGFCIATLMYVMIKKIFKF